MTPPTSTTTSTNPAALLERDPDDAIAYLLTPITAWGLDAGRVCVRQFLQHVLCLAQQLPDQQYIINLCDNRYLFSVTFCAVIARQKTNLLPPNKAPSTQAQLQQRYKDTWILHDGAVAAGTLSATHLLDTPALSTQIQQTHTAIACPQIAPDHLAAISFTSGSTGDAKPVLKYWRTLLASTLINGRYMLDAHARTLYQLATVPPQHMWGLETSVLLPLFFPLCVADSRALLPEDISDALTALPADKMLVTTPVHLRALVAGSRAHKLARILCATSPLTAQLAQQAEQHFQTTLHEIYGCSEIGSMAVRRTAQQDHWQRFSGIDFYPLEQGRVQAGAAHLSDRTELQDRIHIIDQQTFTLSGRRGDMINIAGKRGSLQQINKLLLDFDDVIDGVAFLPQPRCAHRAATTITRLAAMVVLKPHSSKDQLRHYLRRHLDPAFIPRPILPVDTLPREDNGKLPYTKLLNHYHQQLTR
ncbi:MAG: AMP-binding protein [Cellvibrionaceae bacterium]|nr:AMP-binding protein [Cellvibrionaceae bacterium]